MTSHLLNLFSPGQIRVSSSPLPCAHTLPDFDGFSSSDTRINLRSHFEADRYYIATRSLRRWWWKSKRRLRVWPG